MVLEARGLHGIWNNSAISTISCTAILTLAWFCHCSIPVDQSAKSKAATVELDLLACLLLFGLICRHNHYPVGGHAATGQAKSQLAARWPSRTRQRGSGPL